MSVIAKVKEKSKKKKRYPVMRYDINNFKYDIKDYDGYNDNPEDLLDD